ncbi:MAG: hypothetical protein Q7S55_05185 [Nanoarchaeota archaeon]|nr:hypothetical protein [Nanoarchaeota archaeon]
MLDEVVIDQIFEREKRRRKDSGWQPIPLYEELELPRDDSQEGEQIKIDVWEPQKDTVVDNNVLDCYSPNKYKVF